jgi:two-component sensor histidine kinase
MPVNAWIARQKALADFATHQALRSANLEALFQAACTNVTVGLNVPIAKLGLLQHDSADLLLRAVIGIPKEIATPGVTILPGGRRSAMGYALEIGRPVISDVASETRFEPSELIRRSGVRTSINVVLWVNGEPYGCLEADSLELRQSNDSDLHFLQIYADLVSAAIERNLLTASNEALAREREILLNEVFHRIKNILANVLAISRRTIKHSSDLLEFQSAFEGRVAALSRAHDILLEAPSKPARLAELIELEFSAKGLQRGKDFTVQGPDLLCGPRTIQTLALLIFELATNAVKYGALSEAATDAATIEVRWQVEENAEAPEILLHWLERGVKRQPESAKRGFGSELVERLVPQMLRGDGRIKPRQDGIEYFIKFSMPEDVNLSTVPHSLS